MKYPDKIQKYIIKQTSQKYKRFLSDVKKNHCIILPDLLWQVIPQLKGLNRKGQITFSFKI